MSASALPSEARSADQSVSATQHLTPQPKPDPVPPPPNNPPLPLSRSSKYSSTNHTARGESISLARRAAAVAKKKREHARAQFERQGLGNSLDNVLRNFVSADASTRPNVSQNKSRRHKRIKWTDGEVEALRSGVQKHGEGRWAVILRENASLFHPVRISVDLKDKWRNLSKSTKVSVRRPASTASPNPATPPIAAAAHPSTSSVRPSARSTLASCSQPASTSVQHKPVFRALPAITASHPLHQQSPQAHLITPKESLPKVVHQLSDVSSARVVPRSHHAVNLPQFHPRPVSLSRTLPDPFNAIHTPAASAVTANTSSQFGSHGATGPRVAALVNPQRVTVLVRGSQAEHHFSRHQHVPHLNHSRTSMDMGIQNHRPADAVHHTPSVHSVTPARSQPYASVAQLYTSSSGPVATSGSSHVAPCPVSSSYRIHRKGSPCAPKPSGGVPFASRAAHHEQHTIHPLMSENNHLRPLQEAKEPAADSHQDVQSMARHEDSNHALNSRLSPYAATEQRDLLHRDSTVTPPLRLKPEVLPTHIGHDENHSENPSKQRERDDLSGTHNHWQNILGQPDDSGLHHLRPVHSENRFGQEPREEVNAKVRVTAQEDRFVPDQQESGGELQHHRSPHSGNRFDRDADEDDQDDLEHSEGDLHLGIDGQQPALVQTGEDIHNEDSMHHVEVPREVLDNDEEDPAEDDIDRHPHTDPNHPNLYHGNDDEDEDQLAPHHPFGLVNDDVEDSNDEVARDDNQRQPVNELGLTDEQQENAMGLDVRIIDDASSDEYRTDRNRDQISSTAEPDHEVHRPHFVSLVRSESAKGSEESDTVEDDSHRSLLARGKDRVASSGYERHSRDVRNGQTAVRSIDGARFSRHSQSDNCSSAHGTDHCSPEVGTGTAGRAGSSLVDGSMNHVRQDIGGVSQLSSDARDRVLNGESQDFSASAMQSNDSDLGPPKAQLGAEAHLDEAGETNDSKRVVDGRGVSISARPGSTASVGYIHRSRQDCRLYGRMQNTTAHSAEVNEELSPRAREVNGDSSGSDTSKEFIPLVNPAHPFRVTRSKSSVPSRDKSLSGSNFAFDRDQAFGANNYAGLGSGRVRDVTERRGAGSQRYGYEEKEESEARHRVEDVASVANLLNPDSVDQSSYANSNKRSHVMEGRRQMDVVGMDDVSVKRAKTGDGG